VKDHVIGGNSISFRPPRTGPTDEVVFSGNLADAEYLRQWVSDKCIPLVREITFENAEELTEEGLPFLIMFRHPDDHTILETFTQEVARQLADQRSKIFAFVWGAPVFSFCLDFFSSKTKKTFVKKNILDFLFI
jgi:endoplasmic reticulum resident protein 44